MRPLRLVAIAGLAAFTALAVAACSAGARPAWTYAPAPPATPTPSPAASASAAASTAPSPSAAASPAASGATASANAGTAIDLTAKDIQYDKATIVAPAGQAFTIHFSNQDSGVPHDVQIKDASGKVLFDGKVITGVASVDYSIPALPAGTYQFQCKIHPSMVGTLTVGQ